MTSSKLTARLGATAALTALLAAFVPSTHASPSVTDGGTSFAGGFTKTALNDLDGNCAPPNDRAACAAWHKVIRENFSQHEIGILFGTATSYPEYLTSYWRIKSRYQRLHDEFSEGRAAGDAVSAK